MNGVQATGAENPWWVLGMAVIAVAAYYIAKWQAGRATNKKILHQVQNDHKTNLRDDIDHLGLKLDVALQELSQLTLSIKALKYNDENLEDTQRREKRDLELAIIERNQKIADLRAEMNERFNRVERKHP